MTGKGSGAGRPRKPIELRVLEAKGDKASVSHKAKSEQTEVVPYKPGQVELVKPAGLGKRGSVEWDNIWTAGQAWLHKSEDYHLVEMIAKAYDEIAEYEEEIDKTGLIVKGYAGQKTANPLIKEVRNCQALIITCLSKLGFSPTDRARLGLAEIKRQTSLADLREKTQANRS